MTAVTPSSRRSSSSSLGDYGQYSSYNSVGGRTSLSSTSSTSSSGTEDSPIDGRSPHLRDEMNLHAIANTARLLQQHHPSHSFSRSNSCRRTRRLSEDGNGSGSSIGLGIGKMQNGGPPSHLELDERLRLWKGFEEQQRTQPSSSSTSSSAASSIRRSRTFAGLADTPEVTSEEEEQKDETASNASHRSNRTTSSTSTTKTTTTTTKTTRRLTRTLSTASYEAILSRASANSAKPAAGASTTATKADPTRANSIPWSRSSCLVDHRQSTGVPRRKSIVESTFDGQTLAASHGRHVSFNSEVAVNGLPGDRTQTQTLGRSAGRRSISISGSHAFPTIGNGSSNSGSGSGSGASERRARVSSMLPQVPPPRTSSSLSWLASSNAPRHNLSHNQQQQQQQQQRLHQEWQQQQQQQQQQQSRQREEQRRHEQQQQRPARNVNASVDSDVLRHARSHLNEHRRAKSQSAPTSPRHSIRLQDNERPRFPRGQFDVTAASQRPSHDHTGDESSAPADMALLTSLSAASNHFSSAGHLALTLTRQLSAPLRPFIHIMLFVGISSATCLTLSIFLVASYLLTAWDDVNIRQQDVRRQVGAARRNVEASIHWSKKMLIGSSAHDDGASQQANSSTSSSTSSRVGSGKGRKLPTSFVADVVSAPIKLAFTVPATIAYKLTPTSVSQSFGQSEDLQGRKDDSKSGDKGYNERRQSDASEYGEPYRLDSFEDRASASQPGSSSRNKSSRASSPRPSSSSARPSRSSMPPRPPLSSLLPSILFTLLIAIGAGLVSFLASRANAAATTANASAATSGTTSPPTPATTTSSSSSSGGGGSASRNSGHFLRSSGGSQGLKRSSTASGISSRPSSYIGSRSRGTAMDPSFFSPQDARVPGGNSAHVRAFDLSSDARLY